MRGFAFGRFRHGRCMCPFTAANSGRTPSEVYGLEGEPDDLFRFINLFDDLCMKRCKIGVRTIPDDMAQEVWKETIDKHNWDDETTEIVTSIYNELWG